MLPEVEEKLLISSRQQILPSNQRSPDENLPTPSLKSTARISQPKPHNRKNTLLYRTLSESPHPVQLRVNALNMATLNEIPKKIAYFHPRSMPICRHASHLIPGGLYTHGALRHHLLLVTDVRGTGTGH